MNVAEVGDVRHLLQEREVQAASLDQWPGLPDVDGLTPLARPGIEHIHMGVAVHQQEPVRRGGDGRGLGKSHGTVKLTGE